MKFSFIYDTINLNKKIVFSFIFNKREKFNMSENYKKKSVEEKVY